MSFDLIWYDDNPTRTPLQKIERAAQRFTEKFLRKATTAYVHQSIDGQALTALQDDALSQLGIKVIINRQRVPYPYYFIIAGNGNGHRERIGVPVTDAREFA